MTDHGKPRFRLRLLGFPFLAADTGLPVAGLGPGKPLALLAYLAIRGEARRDELVDLLWGEVTEANARNAFRQALHRLRTALGQDIVPQDRDRVALAGTGLVDVDRDEFLAAIDAGEIAKAVELYRGDLLEGFEVGEPAFDGWADAERTRLKGRFQSLLQSGAEQALAAGRWLEALQYVQRLSTLAPYDESAALLEANVLVAAGRTLEAQTTLRRFSQVLRDQLDLAPSAKVREMLSRIERAGAIRDPSTPRPKESPFVGREAEVARMMSLARGLSAEKGATLVLEGPAGIGKTRLVNEFIARARSLGPLLVLRGRERPSGAALPYASIAEALRTALRAPGAAGTGRHLLAEASRILPELRDTYDLPEPGPIEAEGGRLRFFEGIAALMDSTAYEQPVCMVLDDVHLASAATLELVAYLAGRLHASPVLFVLVRRDDVDGADLDRILDPRAENEESGGWMRIALAPLDTDAVREVVSHLADARGAEGQLDVDRVALGAAGNPLRAIDLARRALNGELPPSTPVALRDILWSRLQQASPSQRRVFFAAALLQRRCSLRLLSAAAHLPELAAQEAAQELERLGLLSPEGDSYVVAHEFTASFVVEASGLAGRALLAGWAADALADDPSRANADLAGLYSMAGQQATAFVYARLAVYDAAALGLSAEVHRLLTLARALAPDAKSREQIDAMVAAFGDGRRLIEGASAASSGADVAPDSSTADAPPDAAPISSANAKAKDVLRRREWLTPRLAALVIGGAIVISVAVSWSRSRQALVGQRALRDSLLVAERGADHEGFVRVITGSIDDAASRSAPILPQAVLPAWARELQLPWIRPSISPAGTVAVERMTAAGTDVYLMEQGPSSARPLVTGGGTDAILGWSPDGASLLVRRSRTLSDGSFDADLWAYPVRPAAADQAMAVPIDTAAARSVGEEAVWAPDGSRIAWVAQAGATHQRDIFVGRADGSDVVNVTDDAGEDYHLSWSSDGNLLAFTSDRDGNPDLFAVEFDARSRRLWRLTNTPGEEDFASFSPDHRFVAFHSTAGGDAAVYIMPALGGLPVRVTPDGGQFSIAGWRGRPPAGYLDRLRIIGPTTLSRGDSVVLSLFGIDRDGNPRPPERATVRLSDSTMAALSATDTLARSFVLSPRRDGIVSVIATVPGWRADTLVIAVGQSVALAFSDDFSTGIDAGRWLRVGDPTPFTRAEGGVGSLVPNADMQWQSGLLSRSVVSLEDSVSLSATFSAPFDARPTAGALLDLSLVAEQSRIDSIAPQLQALVRLAWDGEASRFSYSVGSQSRSDPVSAIGTNATHHVQVVITRGQEVLFFVDGQRRWTSSLRFLGPSSSRRARIWLGGKATDTSASISRVKVVSGNGGIVSGN